jgi:hypothetical protein
MLQVYSEKSQWLSNLWEFANKQHGDRTTQKGGSEAIFPRIALRKAPNNRIFTPNIYYHLAG